MSASFKSKVRVLLHLGLGTVVEYRHRRICSVWGESAPIFRRIKRARSVSRCTPDVVNRSMEQIESELCQEQARFLRHLRLKLLKFVQSETCAKHLIYISSSVVNCRKNGHDPNCGPYLRYSLRQQLRPEWRTFEPCMCDIAEAQGSAWGTVRTRCSTLWCVH